MEELYHIIAQWPGGPVLWTAILAVIIAQLLKVLSAFIATQRWDWRFLISSGGMPSSHAAGVTALSIGVGIHDGWYSSLFALSVLMALVIFYDAANVRRAAGEQAKVLNELVAELRDVLRARPLPRALQTLLGHTYPQVFAGMLVGAAVATAVFLG